MQKDTAKAVRELCTRLNDKSSARPDELTNKLLKQIAKAPGTETIFEMLALLLNVIEERGDWPDATCDAFMVLIPKEDAKDGDPLSLRPITVLSVLYRTWAKKRMEDLKPWRTQWANGSTFNGTEEVFWAVAADTEDGALRKHAVFLQTCDAVKCYDTVSWDIIFTTLEARGLDPTVLKPMMLL